ncbi:hypothetical protein LJK88_32520 [Paenibacillus sp. P26]|nr:hypothetical protein LJK88_32520 [Paenibacillus sp. P26]UUZ94096.1 hypothetical protein LJK87_05570 [Paenibacillus sp. P25]
MNEMAVRLLEILKRHEGKDFDATLQDPAEGKAGFSFMSYIETGSIRVGPGRVAVSERGTGKFFCLPLDGIAEIQDEGGGEDDAAYSVTYDNRYSVFIQIFDRTALL